jgi:hypothetical protein
MDNPIKDAARRTQRYWYVDGLVDMSGGTIMLLLAIFSALIYLLGGDTSSAIAVGIGQPVIIIGGVLLARKIVILLKERITYPRTGYVAYRQPHGAKRLATGILTAALALGLALTVVLLARQVSANWIPLITAGLMALVFIYLGWRFDLLRLYILAAFTFLVGLVAAWLNLPDLLSSAFFFGFLGLAWMGSGVFTLLSYLRHTNHLQGEGQNDG